MKANYIQPTIRISGLKLEVMLDNLSGASIETSAEDYKDPNRDIDVDNNPNPGTINPGAKYRGDFYEGF